MRKHSLKTFILVLMMSGSFIFLSWGIGHSAQHYSMGTGSAAAVYFYLGAGFCNLVQKYLPDVQMTAESTAGSAENINLINRKKMDFGFSSPSIIKNMIEAKKLDPSNVAIMAIGHSTVTHWITRKESPIKSVYDFKGKTIGVGPPGSGTLVNMKEDLRVGWNIDIKDIKPAYLSFEEQITALKDNTMDAGKIAAGVPAASIIDLARTINIRLLQMEKEALDKLQAIDPSRITCVIKAGTYAGIDQDVVTNASVAGLFCRRDLSEDLVYKILKAIYEHEKERNSIHPAAKDYVPEHAMLGTGWIRKYMPPHPGMVKYLKEKNLWKE
ncbi:MAG: hypothetical protein A2170_07270 [Deltaproteobacteria bacterium RBG_13_53_10]|nr:MAG: hypothetical protein A2170_07270 [Deltaproteobacteria bacterium RBG_13_53_10]